jgi:hypothetical protein
MASIDSKVPRQRSYTASTNTISPLYSCELTWFRYWLSTGWNPKSWKQKRAPGIKHGQKGMGSAASGSTAPSLPPVLLLVLLALLRGPVVEVSSSSLAAALLLLLPPPLLVVALASLPPAAAAAAAAAAASSSTNPEPPVFVLPTPAPGSVGRGRIRCRRPMDWRVVDLCVRVGDGAEVSVSRVSGLATGG